MLPHGKRKQRIKMTLKSVLVLLGLIVVFTFLIAWISKQGGWQQGGCSGDCSKCQSRCADESKPGNT